MLRLVEVPDGAECVIAIQVMGVCYLICRLSSTFLFYKALFMSFYLGCSPVYLMFVGADMYCYPVVRVSCLDCVLVLFESHLQ